MTNGEWRQFIDDGGYQQQRWWSRRGWTHRQQAGLTAPQFWNPDGTRTRFGHVEVPAGEPVQHVTYFEGRGVRGVGGARLPTEVEWEKAAPGTLRAGAADSLGAHRNPPNIWRTSAVTRCGLLRSGLPGECVGVRR